MTNQLDEQKAAFAAFLLQNPANAFEAALKVSQGDYAYALRIITEFKWQDDPEVIATKKQMLEEAENGEMSFLPGKADLARKIWDRMSGCTDNEEYVKLAKLYADVCGYISKVDTNITVNTQTNNKTLVVRDMGTVEEWENKAAIQQRDLLANARSKH